MLILTEKPSVAAAFSGALGCGRKDGYFESAGYCVVFAVGHLLETYAPEDYDPAYEKWTLKDLPIIPENVKYKVIPETKDQLAVIKKCFAARKGETFLLATDAEREGEVIGAEILNYVGFKDYANAKRFWVSEALTKDVVLKGIKDAKPLLHYAPYREQGFARQQADWLVGINITRFVTKSAGSLLTAGRVQTAVLGAVYEREKQIEDFQKDKYVEVNAVLSNPCAGDQTRNFTLKLFNADNREFPTRFTENDPLIKKALQDLTPDAKIKAVKTEKKTVMPPQLFNLTGLQKEAHKRFGYAPEATLNIAQTLYEKHKCLSYPRTPSVVMGDDNVELIKSIYDKLKDVYPEQSAGADSAAINAGNKRLFNTAQLQDHHALVPQDALHQDAGAEEANVYCLVLERFFTTLKKPYVYNAIKIDADIKGYMFTGNGIEVLQSGWKKDKQDDEAQSISGVSENTSYPVQSITAEEKYTEPKKHYTYASLLQLMENPREQDAGKLVGLGTPATRGGILKNISDRQYIMLKGKSILISGKGKFLIENLQKSDELKKLVSIPETTRWEEELRNDTKQFLENIKQFVRDAIKNTKVETCRSERQGLGKCPVCGKNIYEGQKNYYCAGYREGCRFVLWKTVAGADLSAADVTALLRGKQTRLKKCKKKDGVFEARFVLEGCDIKFIFDRKRG